MEKASYTYHVTAERLDENRARITARDHEVLLNIKKGSGEAGFNAAETLLAALGACLLTNVNAIGAKMRLRIDQARIEFDAVRSDVPPALTEIRYRLILTSPESPEKLQVLAELCLKWGTVTNTLIQGLVPQGSLVVEAPGSTAGDAN